MHCNQVVKQNFLTPVAAVTTAPTRVTTPLDTAEQGGPLVVGQQTGEVLNYLLVQELYSSHLSCWAGVDTILHLPLIPHSCLHPGLSLIFLDARFLPFVIHFQLPILLGVCLWLSILTCWFNDWSRLWGGVGRGRGCLVSRYSQ